MVVHHDNKLNWNWECRMIYIKSIFFESLLYIWKSLHKFHLVSVVHTFTLGFIHVKRTKDCVFFSSFLVRALLSKFCLGFKPFNPLIWWEGHEFITPNYSTSFKIVVLTIFGKLQTASLFINLHVCLACCMICDLKLSFIFFFFSFFILLLPFLLSFLWHFICNCKWNGNQLCVPVPKP